MQTCLGAVRLSAVTLGGMRTERRLPHSPYLSDENRGKAGVRACLGSPDLPVWEAKCQTGGKRKTAGQVTYGRCV